jgi:site-specific DNA recombinase
MLILARSTLRVALEPIYVSEIRHKGVCHPGQHEAILDRAVWDRTQQQLREHRVRGKSRGTRVEKSPLIGRLVDLAGAL